MLCVSDKIIMKRRKTIILVAMCFFTGLLYMYWHSKENIMESEVVELQVKPRGPASKFYKKATSSKDVKDISLVKKRKFSKLLAQKLHAQKVSEKARLPSSGKRFDLLNSKKKSDFKTAEGQSYHRIERLFAVKKDDYPEFKGASEKLGFYILDAESLKRSVPPESLSVVENNETGALGIFTGLISVKFYDLEALKDLSLSVSFNVKIRFDHIAIAHLEFDSYEDTMIAYRELSSIKEVQRVSVEVLEFTRLEQ